MTKIKNIKLTKRETGLLTLMAEQVLTAETLEEAKENVRAWVDANHLPVDFVQSVDTLEEVEDMFRKAK